MSHRLVQRGILAEPIHLAALAAVQVAIGAVVTLDERDVDLRRHRRVGQRLLHLLGRTVNALDAHADYPTLAPMLVHGGIDQTGRRRQPGFGMPAPATATPPGRPDAVNFQQRPPIRLLFFAGEQYPALVA